MRTAWLHACADTISLCSGLCFFIPKEILFYTWVHHWKAWSPTGAIYSRKNSSNDDVPVKTYSWQSAWRHRNVYLYDDYTQTDESSSTCIGICSATIATWAPDGSYAVWTLSKSRMQLSLTARRELALWRLTTALFCCCDLLAFTADRRTDSGRPCDLPAVTTRSWRALAQSLLMLEAPRCDVQLTPLYTRATAVTQGVKLRRV